MWFYHLVFGPTEQNERRLTLTDIQRVAANHFGFTVPELLAHRREKKVALARQITMYVAKKLTLRSLPDLGRRFGDRDHATVLHAVRKIAQLAQTDAQVAADIAAIKAKVTA
jgi:chromosomal replication initiator protein